MAIVHRNVTEASGTYVVNENALLESMESENQQLKEKKRDG